MNGRETPRALACPHGGLARLWACMWYSAMTFYHATTW